MVGNNRKEELSTAESAEQKRKPPVMGEGADVIRVQQDSSFGDVSSIMIKPDQIYGNFNLLEDDDQIAKRVL